ncbi:FecCD family ABC transporter permease [Agarilytica rhodophyticola]|uniref:FecCD family ABC transporter permease n=1 Tax=Agarilytica rhodophyticola TaxID=1737490 RepID=UPI000B343313|nr:iron chelate uptake ABC transporter family permease subunit [Agarilytica rhodophyticola]
MTADEPLWQRYWPWVLVFFFIILILAIYISLLFGAVAMSIDQLFFWTKGVLPNLFNAEKVATIEQTVRATELQNQVIIQQLRLPRALLAASIGALMASCGAITQGLFRNPLADPSLIGVSAGATAGASAVIVLTHSLQGSVLGLSLVSFGAFIGGVLAVIVVYRVATSIHGTSVSSMLLAGIAITFLAGSISNLLEFIADNEMLRRISLWRMGGLDIADYPRVFIVSFVLVPVFFILPKYYAALNALLLGESEARHLGVNVAHIKKIIVCVVAVSVGVSVAIAGTISFMGLVVPHIIRMCIGPNHRFLVPLSALLGALLLLVADVFARTVIAPTELPVGLVTAIIGAPVFISLLRRRHHYAMD